MARVLIIDDSPTDMQAISGMLKKHGHECTFANDGMKGVASAREAHPDVILMDIVMPELNGYQATRRLTQDKDTAHIPVIIISSKTQETDRVWGMRQGARAYICKPINEEELARTIAELAPPH
ncbi:MAG: response regulator [bacterium]|jgi:twitching motility two-component system response regulator PilH|nr:response regulator [bacterium]